MILIIKHIVCRLWVGSQLDKDAAVLEGHTEERVGAVPSAPGEISSSAAMAEIL